MKIVCIFAEKLFAFHYQNERLDEYGRLLGLWNDPEYILDFAEKNEQYLNKRGLSIDNFIEQILTDVEILEENLLYYKNERCKIDTCFQPLYDQEYRPKILSFQKKKCKYLRLYAIRIDENCFVITGGAIKLTQTMQEHPDTTNELEKLNQCKNYLLSENVFDEDSFFEITG